MQKALIIILGLKRRSKYQGSRRNLSFAKRGLEKRV